MCWPDSRDGADQGGARSCPNTLAALAGWTACTRISTAKMAMPHIQPVPPAASGWADCSSITTAARREPVSDFCLVPGLRSRSE